eukprot:1143133-Pelagomonas_calceolata.AAC.1
MQLDKASSNYTLHILHAVLRFTCHAMHQPTAVIHSTTQLGTVQTNSMMLLVHAVLRPTCHALHKPTA